MSDFKGKVKQEANVKLKSFSTHGAALVLGTVPDMLSDGSVLITRSESARKYGLCSVGLSLKQVRLLRDMTEHEVHEVCGPIVNKNGYGYMFCEDPELIAKVENLWMIVHQKPHLPTSRLISLGMARGLVYDRKDKEMN